MIINPKKLIKDKHIHPLCDKSVQINGIDLRLDTISSLKIGDSAYISEEERRIPKYEELLLHDNNEYKLYPHTPYIAFFVERIKVPKNAMGYVIQRSTLNRSGVQVMSSVWDSGYEGKGSCFLNVNHPITIKRFTRIAQIIFFEADPEGLYEGIYHKE